MHCAVVNAHCVTRLWAQAEHFTDELLQEHETYIEHLQQEFDVMKPILKAIETRRSILAQRGEYEALVHDSSRLLRRRGRDSRLAEEKLERRVTKVLPSVTKKLKVALKEWEETHGSPFVWEGVPYLDVIQEEEADHKRKLAEEKEKKAAEKKARLQQDIDFGSSPKPHSKRAMVRWQSGRSAMVHTRLTMATHSQTPDRTPKRTPLRRAARKVATAVTASRAGRTPQRTPAPATRTARTPTRAARTPTRAARSATTRTPRRTPASAKRGKAATTNQENQHPTPASKARATAGKKKQDAGTPAATPRKASKLRQPTVTRATRTGRAGNSAASKASPRARSADTSRQRPARAATAQARCPSQPPSATRSKPTSLKSIIGSPANNSASNDAAAAAKEVVARGCRSGLAGAFTAMLSDCDDILNQHSAVKTADAAEGVPGEGSTVVSVDSQNPGGSVRGQ